MTDPYASVRAVLREAEAHVCNGKGHSRHNGAKPLDEQDSAVICRAMGTTDGLLYQVLKKVLEARRLDDGPRRAELVSAIGCLALALAIEADGERAAAG